jgi:hypothetical protein
MKMSIHRQSLDGMSSLQCQRSVRPQFVESKDEKKAANLPARWHLQSLLAISSLPRLDRHQPDFSTMISCPKQYGQVGNLAAMLPHPHVMTDLQATC